MPKRREPDLTMFSFGYWGWGSSTEELVKAADVVERSRGYKPPIFVDIRISRSVRAPGFNGNSFGDLLGDKRYLWMRRLGNRRIIEKGIGRIQIDDPSAASDLLDLALKAADDRRRLIFFCSCPYPIEDGFECHRVTVSRLLIREAKRRRIDLSVIEWPGEESVHIEGNLTPQAMKSIAEGKPSLKLGEMKRLCAEWVGLPWGSIVTVRSGDLELHRLACPAIHKNGTWSVPFLHPFFKPDTPLSKCVRNSTAIRKKMGLNERRSS